jgi:hypothetical protein
MNSGIDDELSSEAFAQFAAVGPPPVACELSEPDPRENIARELDLPARLAP